MRSTVRLKAIGRHIAFVAAYFFYEAGMLYAYTHEVIYFWDMFWHLLINLCLFYFNAHLVLAYAVSFQKTFQRVSSALLLIGIEFLAFLLIKYLLAQVYIELQVHTTRPYENLSLFFRDTLWRFIYIFGLSFAYWFAISSSKKERQVAALEQARLKDLAEREIAQREFITMENAYLKSQINSHFLFNTLSYLYSEVRALDSDVGETILNLSSIMRYSLSAPTGGKVMLKEEIQHLTNIFNISKLKSGGKLHIDFSVKGDPGDLSIIPLVLITLAENTLKYADLKDPKAPAELRCLIMGSQLTVNIANNKRKFISPVSYGIGLKNTQQRLSLAYPDNYKLDVIDSQARYQLTLTIQL